MAHHILGGAEMKDSAKTKKQLIEELSDLRARVADLEKGNGSKSDPCRHIEMRLADLIELVPEIIFETDPRGNLFFANQTAFDTFGYTQDDIKLSNSFGVGSIGNMVFLSPPHYRPDQRGVILDVFQTIFIASLIVLVLTR